VTEFVGEFVGVTVGVTVLVGEIVGVIVGVIVEVGVTVTDAVGVGKTGTIGTIPDDFLTTSLEFLFTDKIGRDIYLVFITI